MRRVLALSLLLSASLAAAAGAQETAPKPATARFHIRPVALFFEHLYEGTFSAPMGISFDEKANEVWVADTHNNLIGVFTPDGAPLFTFGSDRLREPIRAVTSPDGRVYVLDSDRSKIKVFSYRGDALGNLTLPGVGEKPMFGTITFDADGNFYVGENESCQVLVYSPEFKPRQRFGTCGAEEGQFQAIAGIAVSKDRIVVVDAQVLAVQVFDKHGNFVHGWGIHDMGIQNFSLPASVALDSQGHVVVLDMLRHEIKFFDAEGNFLTRFGGLGSRAGQEAYPSGIVIDSSDRLYVVEKGNQRVQAYVEVAGDFPPNTLDMNRNNGFKGQPLEEKEVPRKSPAMTETNPESSPGLLQQPLGGRNK
jgi:DNA-binding beta-propeller fold protein YncE